MFSNDLDFQKDLAAHHVFTAWQFIQYTKKNISIVEYCATIINTTIEKMNQKTVRWQQDLFSDFVEETNDDGKKIMKVSITTDNSPMYEVRVAGEKVDPWFLFDKLLRDFYQYAMNSFDSISQVANSGLLANRGKKVDAVDFQRMAACFSQQTYMTVFPKTAAWFTTIFQSSEFQYIEAINNRTKHTADISNKLSMGILGSANATKIGPFFRKDVQHNKKELSDQLRATLDFLHTAWNDFLSVFCAEYPMDVFVENREHEIDGVYQQKLRDNPDQDHAYAYINVKTDYSAMPDEMYILLLRENVDEVITHNCPFENILVRDHDNKTILGQYIADGSVGEDCLLTYRKYVKDKTTPGVACHYHAIQTSKLFYRNNPFFAITAVSDDNEFLMRASSPF